MTSLCNLIDDYLNGELTHEQGDDFNLHLIDCAVCRVEVGIAQSLDENIRSTWASVPVPDLELPPVALESTGSNRRQHSSQHNHQTTRRLLTLAASFLVITILGGWFLWFGNDLRNVTVTNKHVDQFIEDCEPVIFLPDSDPTTSVIVAVDSPQNSFTIVRAFEPYRSKQDLIP